MNSQVSGQCLYTIVVHDTNVLLHYNIIIYSIQTNYLNLKDNCDHDYTFKSANIKKLTNTVSFYFSL